MAQTLVKSKGSAVTKSNQPSLTDEASLTQSDNNLTDLDLAQMSNGTNVYDDDEAVILGQESTQEQLAIKQAYEQQLKREEVRSKQFNKLFTEDMEYQYTRSGKYRPVGVVVHKGKREYAAILRQHNEKAFTYIVLSDFDNTDRKYLRRLITEAYRVKEQLHRIMRNKNLKNGNNALEYFLHFSRTVGYATRLEEMNALTGASF